MKVEEWLERRMTSKERIGKYSNKKNALWYVVKQLFSFFFESLFLSFDTKHIYLLNTNCLRVLENEFPLLL